ncbi:hypothetical protein [Pseudomonas putida]|uniref:hypothetical protein n=1 Tax=Pseudomonas putida TaxID=303 RepID=UPI0012600DE0|nr:hypothetical protein [Pseudomonas putida]
MEGSSNREKRGFSDHPVYVAGVAVAGTIALSVAVYKEVILPAQLATSEFKISELSRQLARETKQRELLIDSSAKEKAELSSTLNAASGELQATKTKLDIVSRELEVAKLGALFVEGLSYPTAFDKVKVGQSISEVKKVYLASQIEEDEDQDFVSVKVEHPFFHSVVYYNNYSDSSNISHILYMAPYNIESKVPSGYLQDSLRRAFGEPVEMEKDKYVWRLKNGLYIFKDDDRSVIVAAGGVLPGNWRRVIERFAKKIEEEKVTSSAK